MSSQDENNSKETKKEVPQTVEDIGKDHIGGEVKEQLGNNTNSGEKNPVKEDELKEDGDKAGAEENIVHDETVNNDSQEFDDGGNEDNVKVEDSQDIEKDEIRSADGEEGLAREVGDLKPDENVEDEALGYVNGSDDEARDEVAGSHDMGNHEEGSDGKGKGDLNQQIGEEGDEEVGEYERGEDMDYDQEDEQEGDVDTGESDEEGDDYEEDEEVDYDDEKEGDVGQGDGNAEASDNEEGKIAIDDGENERDTNQQKSDREEDDYEEGEIVDDEDEDVIVEEEEEENDGKEVEKNDEMEEDDWQETEEVQKESERKVTNMKFWAHDNRWMDGFEEERSKARNRKLWDKTDVKWEHDLYVEADQGPKSTEELEQSRHFVESLKNRGRGRRAQRMLKDFVKEDDRARFGRRRNQGDRNQSRGGRNDRNRSRQDYDSLRNESQQRRENNKEIEDENTENRDEETRPRQNERNQRREGSQRDTMGGESSYKDRRGRGNDNAGFNRRKGFDRPRKQDGASDGDRNRETEGDSKGLERDTRGQHRDRQRENRRNEEDREGFDQDTRGRNRDRQQIDRTSKEGKERFDQDTRGRNKDRERGDGDSRTEEDNRRHEQNTRGRNRGDKRTNEDKEGFGRDNTRDRPRGFGNRDDFKRKERDNRRGRDSDARAGMQHGGFGRPSDKKREEKEENWEEDLHERKNKETENGDEREVQPERFRQRGDNNENRTRNNDRSSKENRQESEHETKEERRGRKPRSPEEDGSSRRRSDERREEMNDRRRRRRTTSDRSDGEDEEKKQAAQKTAKAENQESTRNKETSSDARGTRKWSEMRTKGVGRGRPLNKPKKTAADFAREVELERRKSEELEAEEVAAVVETERFTNAGSGGEAVDQEVQEHGGEVLQNENPVASEPAASGARKRYSAQRQKPVMATTVQPPLQPVAIPESTPREPQLIYVTPHGFPPMYYGPQPTLQTQEINPTMLRPILIQNGHYAMGPPRNAPPGEYVQNIPQMQPEQYDHSQNFADPNTGMIYPPQQFPMMQPFMPQQVYPTDLPPPAFYQQNIPAPPRQENPQSLPTMQPPHQVLVQTGQTSSGRKHTSAIPIKSPQTEEQL